MSFVNLSRVRQQQAAAAAEAARLEAQAASEQQGGSARAQHQDDSLPSTPPATLSPPRTNGTSPPISPFRAPVSSLLVRRHNTVGGKPQRTRYVKRVEEEDEENHEQADSFDGDSVTTEESSQQGHGSLLPGANLTRHGSLPTRTAPYPISPVRTGFSSASRPRIGTRSSQDHFESIASVTGGASELYAYGAEDDEEWERALAEGRRNGGATAAGKDYYDGDTQNISSSAPKNHTTLHHQRSLPHQRSLNFISSSGTSGSRSPPLLPPHQYHLQQQAAGGGDFFPSSSSTSQLPPTSPGNDLDLAGYNHQRSVTSNDSSSGGVASSIRRHQSLTQAGVHSRISDRLNRSPFTDPNSRNDSDDEGTGRRLGIDELLPPTSPVKRSPWNAPPQNLLSRQRSWDGDQGASAGGPLSPVPGSGLRWRREESGSSNGEQAMSAEQLQNAFDAISLGRSMAVSTSSLHPPPLPRSGATTPDSYNLSNHSRSISATNSNHSLNLHPAQHPVDRGRHSRSPSLNPPPPRFASPSPGPSSSTNATTPTPPDGPHRPSITVPSFSHHRPSGPGISNSSPSSSGTAGIKLSLITDATALERGSTGPRVGPQSAAAYVPPVGHSTQQPLSSGGFGKGGQFGTPPGGAGGEGGTNGVGGGGGGGGPNQQKHAPFTAMGTGWEQKRDILGARPPYMPQQQPQNIFVRGNGGFPQQPFLPLMQQSFGQQANFLSGNTGIGAGIGGFVMDPSGGGMMGGPGGAGGLPSPVDVASLAQAKGYNPLVFDTNPSRARFFVIKSYTEDDVAKSLKFEIWSSTTFGNKRLDKAFKESAAVMPIYLFFSVNSSGHFAGVAQMLTEVDYNTTSTVWAQDKWKGVFRLRWLFVKDVPNQALRHIRLNNVPERKPVTNSRDTQELLPEAGIEMLKIFHGYQSRTSLLQDYAFYDQNDTSDQTPVPLPSLPLPLPHLPPFPAYHQHPSPSNGYQSSGAYQQQQQRY